MASPGEFKFRYFHECISLARKRHVIQFLRANGSPAVRTLRGRPAVFHKNLILDNGRMVCDFVRCDDHGLVTELYVMVRPLSGAIALAERMQVRLGLSPGRGS